MTTARSTVLSRAAWLATLCVALNGRGVVHADEDAIVRRLGSYLTESAPARRAQLAQEIAADPAFDRARVSGWLHRAAAFKPFEPGRAALDVPLSADTTRPVALRIPRDYDPSRPYPLLYVLHGTGGDGPSIIAYVEQLLGPEIEQYLVAAPTGYAEVVIHDRWPPLAEHPAILTAVRRVVHVDSDRVFVIGYSRGGHAAWTIAVLYADQFAGALPIAGSFNLPEIDRLWEVFLPNLTNTAVLCVWGAHDILLDDGRTRSPDGGIAGLNRKLREVCERLKLPVEMIEVPDKGHGGIAPPADALERILARRRMHDPATMQHKFRAIQQARAYWLEGLSWRGPQWTDAPLKAEAKPKEDPREAVVRAFRSRLGELGGTVRDQLVDVQRNKIDELTIWIGDGMIDWTRPVTVKVSGKKEFEGPLTPDLAVCLAEAARTYDFERLRWAGLRFKSGAKLRLITPADIPPLP